jgi:hypothetical protein
MLAADQPVGVGLVVVDAALGIDEVIADHAVVRRPAAGGDRVLAHERHGRERRLELGADALALHAVERGGRVRVHRGGREAVEEEHHDGARLRLRGGRERGGGEDGCERRACAHSGSSTTTGIVRVVARCWYSA